MNYTVIFRVLISLIPLGISHFSTALPLDKLLNKPIESFIPNSAVFACVTTVSSGLLSGMVVQDTEYAKRAGLLGAFSAAVTLILLHKAEHSHIAVKCAAFIAMPVWWGYVCAQDLPSALYGFFGFGMIPSCLGLAATALYT